VLGVLIDAIQDSIEK